MATKPDPKKKKKTTEQAMRERIMAQQKAAMMNQFGSPMTNSVGLGYSFGMTPPANMPMPQALAPDPTGLRERMIALSQQAPAPELAYSKGIVTDPSLVSRGPDASFAEYAQRNNLPYADRHAENAALPRGTFSDLAFRDRKQNIKDRKIAQAGGEEAWQSALRERVEGRNTQLADRKAAVQARGLERGKSRELGREVREMGPQMAMLKRIQAGGGLANLDPITASLIDPRLGQVALASQANQSEAALRGAQTDELRERTRLMPELVAGDRPQDPMAAASKKTAVTNAFNASGGDFNRFSQMMDQLDPGMQPHEKMLTWVASGGTMPGFEQPGRTWAQWWNGSGVTRQPLLNHISDPSWAGTW